MKNIELMKELCLIEQRSIPFVFELGTDSSDLLLKLTERRDCKPS